MSQADGTIANGTGGDVRVDIQAQVQASFSTHIGNSAPSTPYQGQHWIDNNTPSSSMWTESVYDGAAWIPVLYINTSTDVAYPVSAMPLLGFSAQGSPVMTGDIRTTAATAVPGASNSTTGYNLASNGTLHLSNNGSYVFSCNRNSSGVEISFALNGTQVGSISVSGSTTTYATSSDYRLKTNIEPIDWRESARVLAKLELVSFNWISQPLGDKVDGWIAHEAAKAIPHMVTGVKDDVDSRGNIIPQGVDQSKAVPHAVNVINGLVALVADLAARIEALEAK